MKNTCEYVQEIKEANNRIVNLLETMIPIKKNDENPFNGVEHTKEEVDFIMENSNYFFKWSSKEMTNSLNYFKNNK